MTKQRIQIGAINSGSGDTLRAAMIKINNNFDELYDLQGQDSSGQGIDINGNTITSNFEDTDITLSPNGTGDIVMDGDLVVTVIKSDDSTEVKISDSLNVTGTVTATAFVGDGSGLTGVSGSGGGGGDSTEVYTNILRSNDSTAIQVADNLVPTADDTFSLGTADKKWSAVHVSGGTIFLGNLQIKDSGSNSLQILRSDGSTTAAVESTSTTLNVVGDDSTDMEIVVGTDRLHFQGGTNIETSTDSGAQLTISTSNTPTFSGTVTAGGLTIGSAVINEAELETIDGVTAGTVAASKAVIVDANKDAASFRNITATGAVTGGSFVIGSADISEADLEKLDGITNGTAAANKAIVADGNIDVTAIRNLTLTGNIQVGGDMTVSGTTTSVNTTNLEISDALLELNKNNSGGADTDAGLLIQRGSAGNNAAFYWNEGADKFKAVLTTSAATASAVTDSSTATIVANLEGAVTGNADTATALATARNIGGVSFDGTGNINLPGVNTAGDQDTSGTAAIATKIIVTDNESTNENNVILFASSVGDSSTASGSGVESDGNMTYNPSTGKITATGFIGAVTGDVTGDVTGNADTATALATARTIGGVSFDGTGNINLPGVNTAGNQNTSGTAAIATLVTVTDNENTNEENVVTFVAGADADGGNVGLESDGNFTYNPSTGAVTATKFKGDGSELTGISGGGGSSTLNVVGDDSTDMEITLGTDRLYFQGGTNISTSTDSGAQLTITVADAPTFSGAVTAAGFTIGSAAINESELETIDGVTAGTVAASKAVVVDSNKDATGFRNVTGTGDVEGASLTVTSGVAITASSGDVTVANATSNKDLIFTVNDGGSATEVMRLDGDVSALLVASGKELRFADSGEKISGDGTDLTIASGAKINLTATSDVVVPANVGITFGTGEKIEGDNTDLTITSGAKINLAATSDVHIPNDVGIVFGGDSEKIEGDGTDLVISANNLTVDAAADIILDAGGNDFQFKAGGTHILSIVNSSSDVIIKPIADAKDIILQQRDGTEVARVEDNGTFNIVTDKLAINGTAVTSTAAELNFVDGSTAGTVVASKAVVVDSNKDAGDFRNLTGVTLKGTTSLQTPLIEFTDGDNAITIANGGGITANTSLTLASGATVTAILDEDNFASDSDTALATQQSIKAYVGSQTGSSISMRVAGSSDSTQANIDLSSNEEFRLIGGNSITTTIGSTADNTMTVALDDNIAIDELSAKDSSNIQIKSPILADSTITSGAITSSGVVTATGFTIGSAAINETELETIDGITAGTVAASKAVIVDSNKDVTGFRNVTGTGDVEGASLTVSSGVAITASSGDVTVANATSDKDLIFTVNDGGSATEVFRLDGDVSAMLIASGKELRFADSGEKISSDGTDLTIASGAKINLGATSDVHLANDIGLVFGDAGEKIEGDGTDLTITGNNIKLTATADVVIPANVGITFGTGEKIEGDSTDLTVTSGGKINLTATSDVHIPNDVGIVFGDAAEKIEGDGTDLTITGNNIKLTAAADIVVPANVGITFGTGEKIEGDSTDLTVTSGAKINLNATSDIHIPNDVGIVFGGASEKIEGDGTDLVISANNLTVDAAADIILDAGGNDFQFKAGGTHILSVVNSSSDVIIKPIADAKDIIFQQRDGTEVARVEDNATFNVVTGKLAINGTAITSTAAELNLVDGITAGTVSASKAVIADSNKDALGFRNISATGTAEIGGDLQVGGNFTVSGTTTSVNTTNIEIQDALLELNKNNSGGADVDAGIFIQRGSAGNNAVLYWNEGDDTFKAVLSNSVATADAVTDSSFAGLEVGSLTVNAGVAITASSGDVTVANATSNKDLIFTVNDGGSATEVMRLDGDVSAILVASGKELRFADSGEKISGDGTDLTIASGAKINLSATSDVVIPANVGITFGDGEKIEGDDTNITVTSGGAINLTATTDVVVPANVGITFGTGEKIEGDNTDLTVTSGAKIVLAATSDVEIPANVGITFGTGEKIEGDNTDLTITSGADITLAATADVNIPVNVGLRLGDGGENIETDNTDLTITSGGKINLATASDVHLANDKGIVFGDAGEKIEGDGTDLTISSSAKLNLTASSDVHIPKNIGLVFDDNASEKIESDDTDLTIASGAKINLNATSDVHIPNDVGIVFGGASEKIEGDGTDLVISANNLTVDAAADIILDAGGNDLQFKAGGTHVLSITNSSSDVIIKPIVDAKDIIFQQRDGTEVARIEDNATFNVVTGKLAINGTAITSTAAELNALDGITAVVGELNALDIGSTAVGTAVASKAVILDSNKDYTGIRNLTTTGSFIIGNADMNETDLEKLDGITNGTVAANKAVVVDGDKDAGSFRNITATGTVTTAILDVNSIKSTDSSNIRIDEGLDVVGGLFLSEINSIDSSAIEVNEVTNFNANVVVKADVTTTGSFIIGSASMNETDLEKLDGITNGAGAANKALVLDGSADVASGLRNLTASGTITGGTITLDGGFSATESSGDVTVANATSNKDLIFTVNDGGSATEVFRLDGDVSALLVASGKELRFADSGEKISGDGTDLTIASGAKINLTATSDVVVPANVGITFGTGEKIEGDNTDLTITSGAKINLAATSDVHIPNDVGIVFGGDSEKIEGDGTDLVISANNLTVDAAADIILDAGGNDFQFKAGGTHILSVVNSSSDVIIKPIVDAKDIIFQQRDGTEVARVEDNGTFNVVTSKLAINGTAITSTAAELNALDGITAVVGELNALDLGSTAVGTAIASKAVILDSNKDYTGLRNVTLSGELDAGSLDISGDADIDGTLETDALTIGGTAIADVIAGTTVNLATLASTVTITDNESTNENNALVFTAGGDTDGGNLGLESDGTCTYNPSTGKITATGFVGDLTGTASAAQYSDLAERYHADAVMEKGDIVEIGGENEITKSTQAVSPDVFGVISHEDQAAFKMNDGLPDDTHPLVALTGRADVKVIGPINKGDRLVTSSTPGVARKALMSECTAFTVIGRALQDKTTEDISVVLCYVNAKS